MNPFQSLREYELFVYALPQQYPRIVRSTLVVAQRGRFYAEVNGEIGFPDAYRLTDPHHKHLPPDIKHHRIPAPGLNLDSLNLIFLIREIEALLPSA